ncbi:ComEA family DNA-binding protein [Pontibacterium granulatum]|uniref:ComEA family DNA-binding protein n=1 Tax=Pontibacterium granulatum TaxID=2036029 RepID=UPI00249A5462|nr:ComEA family DNA-binding protein [Pontibacterium granulatum]MDI3322750.1 ComEA family DNA-binding protein [Pontibacterium granulatum]
MTLLSSVRALLAVLFLSFSLSSIAAQPEPIDLNTASVQEIAKNLAGIGKKKALAIVDYRSANGPFMNVDDLAKVKGIGKATVEKNRHLIIVGKPAVAEVKP